MNKVIITKCFECSHWLPADSYGNGSYCEEYDRLVTNSNDNDYIPDWCPKLNIIEDKND